MTLLERRCLWLAQSMQEARKLADADPESSCWEKLEGILADLEARLGQRNPEAYRPSPVPPPAYRPSPVPPPAGASISDIEFGRAMRAAHRGLVT
jgi:hypothetical protein